MIKFKVISRSIKDRYDLDKMEKSLNDFLDSHNVVSMNPNWFCNRSLNILTYNLTYRI